MKTDLYTKTILTIIACCLTFNVLKDVQLIPQAYATLSGDGAPIQTALPMLRANEDGSLNVRLTAADVVKVEPASSYTTFRIEPSSSSEFKVKPASSAEFEVKPSWRSEFEVKVKSSSINPVYVKSTTGTTYSDPVLTSLSQPTAFPNPARERITITYKESGSDTYLTICSLDGKVMDYILLDTSLSEVEVNLSNYQPGVYIYHLNGKGGKFIVK